MQIPKFSWNKKQKGQATVEFAFIFPIFIGVFVGLVFFALLFYSYVTLQLAVREGASELVHHPLDTTYAIRRMVCDSGFSLAPAKLSVKVEPPDTAGTAAVLCSGLNTSEGVYAGWQTGVSVSVTGYYTVPLPNVAIPTVSGSLLILGPMTISAQSIMTFD
jgi:Flp pilus assembly protein TadG